MTGLAESAKAHAKSVVYKHLFADKEWDEWAEAEIRKLEEHMQGKFEDEFNHRMSVVAWIGYNVAVTRMLRYLRNGEDSEDEDDHTQSEHE